MLISLIISAVLTLLLFVPLSVRFSYEESFTLKASFLFFTVYKYPGKAKKKKEKKAKKNKKKKKKRPALEELNDKKGFNGAVSLIKDFAALCAGALRRVLRGVTVKSFDLNMRVASGDAAKTALNYAHISNGIYASLAVISGVIKIKKNTISIIPDFTGEKSEVKFNGAARINQIIIFYALIRALIGALRIVAKNKKERKDNAA